MKGIPRKYVAATNPDRSPTTPTIELYSGRNKEKKRYEKEENIRKKERRKEGKRERGKEENRVTGRDLHPKL
jgi:hypothetical protein